MAIQHTLQKAVKEFPSGIGSLILVC